MIGYSKDQQLNHGRLRPKKESTFGKASKPLKQSRMKNKRVTTDDELDYLNWSKKQDYVCFVCGTKKQIQMHHTKRDSTSKKNHKRIIPLCYDHHLGSDFSAHGSPSLFREKYPMEIQEAYADSLYDDYEYKLKLDE